jgi:hypothetical protein
MAADSLSGLKGRIRNEEFTAKIAQRTQREKKENENLCVTDCRSDFASANRRFDAVSRESCFLDYASCWGLEKNETEI